MFPYIAIGILLAALMLLTALGRPSQKLRYVVLAVVILFAGLRYQVGYDWLGYEKLFDFVPNDWDFSQYGLSRYILSTEPIFYSLNVIIKSLGGSFNLLLIALTVFNLLVIDRLSHKVAPGSE